MDQVLKLYWKERVNKWIEIAKSIFHNNTENCKKMLEKYFSAVIQDVRTICLKLWMLQKFHTTNTL